MREVAVFTGKKFELKNKTEVINDIITNNQGHLDDFINREDIIITQKQRTDVDDIVDNLHKMENSNNDSEVKKYSKIVSDLEYTLYNNKDVIIESQKKKNKTNKIKS